jgi:PAS domain S-box-containing protein
MSVTDPAWAGALLQHREQQHAAAWPRGLVLVVLVGGLLLALVWRRVPPAALAVALLAWAMALCAWAGVGLLHRRRLVGGASSAAGWLRRYRAAFLLHGLVWALVAAALPRWLDGSMLDLAVVALATLIVGVLVITAFDLVAGWLFALPLLLALLTQLLPARNAHLASLAALLTLFALATALAARRSQQAQHETVRARLAQAEQHRLLTQLMASTDEGFWFFDRAGLTSDLNPAMSRLLGREREAVLGRGLAEFLSPAERTRLLQATAPDERDGQGRGRSGSCEIDLVRPDGSLVHLLCRNTALHDARGQPLGSVGIWSDISERRRAELAWRDHERLTNSITDMVSVVGEDRLYRIVNDAWCAGMGMAREQVLGRSAFELFKGGGDPEREQAIDACLASGQPQRVTNLARPLMRPDSLVETTFAPFFSTAGGVRCVVAVSRDVTEREHARQALQRAEAQQRALLDAFPGLIGCLDRELNYTYVNPALARLIGLPPEQIVGHHAREVLGPERAQQMQPLAQRTLAGETLQYEHRHRLRDGSPGPYSQVTLTPGRDPRSGQPTIVGFAIDITERKRAERALIVARDDAESASRAKSQFLSQMSHELRTPLNAILGFGQLLQADAARLPHQEPWVQEILRGAQHLLDLINPMLDLGSIESGELQLASAAVPLAPLADEALAMVQPLAHKHRVVLVPIQDRCRCRDQAAMADRTRLKQVLLNLLSNAIKYNRAGGRVWVECGVEGDGQVRLSVHDDGPGLTPEQQALLFQPFERLAAARSAIEGTGIGLALCRRLVLAMGGEMGVQSTPGQGSCFWVRLPATAVAAGAPAPQTAPPAAAPPVVPGTRRRVLYIEDNPVNLALMEAMLARLPEVELLTADEPERGLALARTEGLALVLLDIQLPGMSGFEVLARLREDPATGALPVVAVSANALPAQVQAATAAGFDAYLTKPVLLQQLLDTVRGYLAQR